jgi:hypothetical protein
MGAWLTEQRAEGRDAHEAYGNALRDAEAEYGHQQGYSGTINSKDHGFILVQLPPRWTYRKLQQLLEDFGDAKMLLVDAKEDVRNYAPCGIWHGTRGWKGRLSKAQAQLTRANARFEKLTRNVPPALATQLDGLVERYNDKWGPPLCIELPTREAKPQKRGRRVYVFFGYAPS